MNSAQVSTATPIITTMITWRRNLRPPNEPWLAELHKPGLVASKPSSYFHFTFNSQTQAQRLFQAPAPQLEADLSLNAPCPTLCFSLSGCSGNNIPRGTKCKLPISLTYASYPSLACQIWEVLLFKGGLIKGNVGENINTDEYSSGQTY